MSLASRSSFSYTRHEAPKRALKNLPTLSMSKGAPLLCSRKMLYRFERRARSSGEMLNRAEAAEEDEVGATGGERLSADLVHAF